MAARGRTPASERLIVQLVQSREQVFLTCEPDTMGLNGFVSVAHLELGKRSV